MVTVVAGSNTTLPLVSNWSWSATEVTSKIRLAVAELLIAAALMVKVPVTPIPPALIVPSLFSEPLPRSSVPSP